MWQKLLKIDVIKKVNDLENEIKELNQYKRKLPLIKRKEKHSTIDKINHKQKELDILKPQKDEILNHNEDFHRLETIEKNIQEIENQMACKMSYKE
ncbi:hypothetical protein [Floccifex sp.]|uniref:hypothetical protein n=1 Tax=Floccifex sp. TaxID=2815810 RepID=UPI003F010710